MGEKLLINVSVEETRLALVDSGVLSNIEIDTARLVEAKGNVYKGVVHRVNASLQAAFVDYGAEKQGFLPVSEIHDRYHPGGKREKKAPIQSVLREGQELMVQVVKDEIGSKGASLTTYLSLPGRYMVLMPDSSKTGISRRVPGPERNRLKKIVEKMPIQDGFGVIVRTAGIDRSEEELGQDLEFLQRLWENLETRFEGRPDAGLIHRERNGALRFIRDYATENLDEIIVDEVNTYEEVRDFCTVLVPEMKKRVRYYDDPTPLFSRYQVEDQIDDVFARKIDLPSGGSIVIDQTEALVAIDVNSGRVKGGDIEETALTTNLEAASEVARQLKLRDRGGLVVVDFIDMRSKDNIREVEQAARDAFSGDKAKVKFSRISEFGLMEISRQRLKSALMKGSFDPCPHCGGTGQVRSVESSALYVLRRVKEAVLRGTNYMHATAQAPVAVANYLLNRKRAELTELERQSGVTIDVQGAVECPPNRAYVEVLASSGGRGRGVRRMLLAFDLVRSDVDKRELDDVEDVLVEAAKARGVNLTEDEFDHMYRSIQARMAEDTEVAEAQAEAQKKAAKTRSELDGKRLEADRAQKEEDDVRAKAERRLATLLEREAKVLRGERSPDEEEGEPGHKAGFIGWMKRVLGGAPAPAAEKARKAEPPRELPAPSEKRSRGRDDRRKASGDSGGGRRSGGEERKSQSRSKKGGDDAKEGSTSSGDDARSRDDSRSQPSPSGKQESRKDQQKAQGQSDEDKSKRKRRRRRRKRKKPQDKQQSQGDQQGGGKKADDEKKADDQKGGDTPAPKKDVKKADDKGGKKADDKGGKKAEDDKGGRTVQEEKPAAKKDDDDTGGGKPAAKKDEQKPAAKKDDQKPAAKKDDQKPAAKKPASDKVDDKPAAKKKPTAPKAPPEDKPAARVPKAGVIDLRGGRPKTRPPAAARPKAASRPDAKTSGDEKEAAGSPQSSKE